MCHRPISTGTQIAFHSFLINIFKLISRIRRSVIREAKKRLTYRIVTCNIQLITYL
ncbi:hypothetical protein Hdeb2414_s0027g00696061 [Helianthus debilis subsp. tardiflorus]